MGEFGDDPDDEKQLEVEMCRLVRYRLEHENYLKEEEYEKLLFPCFEKMKARLPVGLRYFMCRMYWSGIQTDANISRHMRW